MLRTASIGVALGAACAALLAAWPAARAQTVPAEFAVQPVVLEPFAAQPVAFAFLPDGRVLVTEKDTGNVRLAAVGSTASVVVGTVAGVTAQSERGLLGVAVDPAWPVRPYVYFHSTHVDSTIHITMYTATGDLVSPGSTNLTLGSPYLLLGGLRDRHEHHNGGTLRFGPDGHLYASLGDDGSACDAQQLSLLQGKILRLDVSAMPGPGTGPPPRSDLVPPDNPYSGPGDAARLVYAYGLRNPFRFTIDAATGNLYVGDVGLLSWEEVDELVAAGYAGANCGWPAFEGLMPDPCCSECATYPPFLDPVYVYPNPVDPFSASVVAGPVYRRPAGALQPYPRAYDGSLFVADFYGRWIRRLARGGGGWQVAPPVPGQPDTLDWAVDLGKPSDLQLGPDGALYFTIFPRTTLARGVWRIVYTGATDALGGDAGPVAVAHTNPIRRRLGTTFAYRAACACGVRLRIFAASGRVVRILEDLEPRSAGRLSWDGRAGDGSRLGAGVYYYELTPASGPPQPARGRLVIVP